MKSKTAYFVYILECNDGTLYTGISNDVARRFARHQKGTGAHYTKVHGVSKLLYTERHKDIGSALKREAAIKRLSRERKFALMGTPARLH